MRVVHVAAGLEATSGGLARAVALIAASHHRSGFPVTVLTSAARPSTTPLPPGIGALHFTRGAVSGRFGGSRGLWRWLRSEVGPDDTVHVHGTWDLPAVWAARRAHRVGARLVISPHGSLEPFDVRKHAVAKQVLGPLVIRSLLNGAVVHCTAQREARSLLTYGARPEVQVLPLPLGPRPPRGDAGRFRRAHAIPTGVPLLLFLGRVNYKKGITHLVRALARMRTRAHLVIAGAGEPEYEAAVRAEVEDSGLTGQVTWTGWLDGQTKADALAAADLFVLLSDAENYGIAVVEALQHGAAVVVSDQVGAAEDLAPRGALLLAPREPRAAAAQLDRVLADDALRRHVVRRAEQALLEVLSPAALDPRYADLATGDTTTGPTDHSTRS